MTETEKKALALVNDVAFVKKDDLRHCSRDQFREAFCRALEQHEAFRQEVSDAVEYLVSMPRCDPDEVDLVAERLGRFIIAKPDPLVEAWKARYPDDPLPEASCADLRAAIEKRGGKIVWGEG